MAARINKIKHDEKTKDKIRASQLLNFLANAALRARKGKPVDPVRVAAAKAALPFLLPTLSSIEQTVHDERDTADPNVIAARLAALFNEKPELFEQVIALRSGKTLDVVAAASTSVDAMH